MAGKSWRQGKSLLVENSSDSEWILNKNSEKLLGVELKRKFIGNSWNFGIQ
jgi:hypothetical protein